MVGFGVFMALFFYFSGCLTFFMIVRDNNEEVILRGDVLWDKVGLPTLRLLCGLGEGLAGGETSSVGWSQLGSHAHLSCSPDGSAGRSEALSQAPRALRRAVGKGFAL